MQNEEYTMKHIWLYFLSGIVGMLNLYIAWRIYKYTPDCRVKDFLLPLILGIILVAGFIIGVMFFSNYEDSEKGITGLDMEVRDR